MKKILALTLLLLHISSLACADIFEGTLGPKKIRATLKTDQNQVIEGAYFYLGQDATLLLTNDKPPQLSEVDSLTFEVSGLLQLAVKGDQVTGLWIHPKTGKTAPVSLTKVIDQPIETPPLAPWKESWGKAVPKKDKPCSIDTQTLTDIAVQSYGKEFASAYKKIQQKIMHANEGDSCSNPEPNSTFSVTCDTTAVLLKKRFVSLSWSCSGESATDGSPTGAHPANGRYAFVFDLQAKKQLGLSELVKGPLKFMENPGKTDFFLSPLGATFFFPDAGNASYASSTTAPYTKLSTTLKRIGKPQPLANVMEF